MRSSSKLSPFFNYTRFYLAYSAKRYLFYGILSALAIANILAFVFVLKDNPSTSVITNSILLYLPFFASNIILPAFLGWFLFGKVRHDNVQLFILSRGVHKTRDFWLRAFLVFIIPFAFSLIMALILAICKIGFGVNSENIAASFFLLVVAAIIQILFFASIIIVVSLAFKYIISLVVIAISTILFVLAPILASFALQTQPSNSLSYNPASNQTNYINVKNVNESGVLQNDKVVIYRSANSSAKNNTLYNGSWNLNPEPNVGILFDNFVTVPYSSLLGAALTPTSEVKTDSSNNYLNSLFTLKDSFESDISPLLKTKQSSLLYSLNHPNPIDMSYENVLTEIQNYYQLSNLVIADNTLTNLDNSLSNFVNTISRIQIWRDSNDFMLNIERHRNALRFLLGINNHPSAPLVFYLFRDWTILKTRYFNLFTDLISRGMPVSLVRNIEFFLSTNVVSVNGVATSDPGIVRQNVLADDYVITHDEIAGIYPFFPVVNQTERATEINISQVINLINGFNLTESGDPNVNQSGLLQFSPALPSTTTSQYVGTVSVRVTNSQGTSYKKLSLQHFPFRNEVQNRDQWRNKIDLNNSYLAMKNIYDTLSRWISTYYSDHSIAPIEFQANDFNIAQFSSIISTGYANSFVKTTIVWIVIGVMTVVLFAVSNRIYEKKEIR